MHLGHGCLVSSFFSPNLNKRTDRYGGDMARRAALARRVVERVRREAGDSVAVTAKFNMYDGVRGGFWLTDSLPTARLCGLRRSHCPTNDYVVIRFEHSGPLPRCSFQRPHRQLRAGCQNGGKRQPNSSKV